MSVLNAIWTLLQGLMGYSDPCQVTTDLMHGEQHSVWKSALACSSNCPLLAIMLVCFLLAWRPVCICIDSQCYVHIFYIYLDAFESLSQAILHLCFVKHVYAWPVSCIGQSTWWKQQASQSSIHARAFCKVCRQNIIQHFCQHIIQHCIIRNAASDLFVSHAM